MNHYIDIQEHEAVERMDHDNESQPPKVDNQRIRPSDPPGASVLENGYNVRGSLGRRLRLELLFSYSREKIKTFWLSLQYIAAVFKRNLVVVRTEP